MLNAFQVLSGIVSNVEDFAPIEDAGCLKMEDLGPDKELYIFRMPVGVVSSSYSFVFEFV